MEPATAPERGLCAALTGAGLTVATAESCTGGLVAHRLTNIPGASACFLGGVVAYSNEAKVRLAGVRPATLAAHGAVSEPVARELAEGVRAAFGSTFGVGITGIAGPTGGSPEKPVGLVHVAVAGPEGTVAARHQFTGPRESIKQQTADQALTMLERYLG